MAEVLNPERPEKLSLVVFSGDFDKVHYALVMASAAAAIDTPVTLFFTMEGARPAAPRCRQRAGMVDPANQQWPGNRCGHERHL